MCDSCAMHFLCIIYLIVTRAHEISIITFLFRDEKPEGQRAQLAKCHTANCGVG